MSVSDTLNRMMSVDDNTFIDAMYKLFLGRDPDDSERRHFQAKLWRGDGRISSMAEVAASQEARNEMRAVPNAIQLAISSGVHPFILDELLGMDGSAFVRLAFLTILQREPDSSGLQTYNAMLRRGAARLLILMFLRTSSEGHKVRAEVPGLDRAIARYRWARLPFIGKWLRRAGLYREPVNVAQAVRRIQDQLEFFKGTPLGSALAERQALNRNACLDALRREDNGHLTADEQPSEKVTGNPALPARVWVDEVRIKRIVILKLDHMGDFFVSVRPMVMLRDAWPEANITLICGPWNVALAEQLGIFDQIVPYRFFTAKTGEEEFNWDADDWAKRCDGVANLGLGAFDLAIDLRHDSDTRPCLTKLNARIRVGFASPGGPLPATPPLDLSLLETPPDYREQLHAETRLVALVAMAIEALCPPQEHPIRRLIKAGSVSSVPFDGMRDYAVIAPGAGSPNRVWAADNFVALMTRLHDQLGLGLVVVGGPNEAEVNAAIAAHFLPEDCLDLTGCPIGDLPKIVDQARLYIGNDTGGGHLAGLLGTPTLSLYGGVSDPRVWQPIGPRVSILHSRTPCAYCHINLRKDCHHDVRCMTEIQVDDAFKEAKRLYNRWAHVGGVGSHGHEEVFG